MQRSDGEIAYQPVVISEFARKGDLKSYAATFKGQSPERIASEAEYFFRQLSDFSVKLIDSGHYHPDIKLSNFLTDGTRVIVSDRKTITTMETPRVSEIFSSPLYGAPEFQQCINKNGDGYTAKAYSTKLNMPSYMSYQIGMALKEFMYDSGAVSLKNIKEEQQETLYLQWNSIAQDIKSPANDVQNISILIQELTRAKASERLPLNHFQTLLEKISLPKEQFLNELNELSPQKDLDNNEAIEVVKEFLNADQLTPDLEKKLNAIANEDEILQDPRLNMNALLQGKPLQKIQDYLQKVNKANIDDLLAKNDLQNANRGQRFLRRLTRGRHEIPRASTLADIQKDLPTMDKQTAIFANLYLEHGKTLPGIRPSQKNLLSELLKLQITPPIVPAENIDAPPLKRPQLNLKKNQAMPKRKALLNMNPVRPWCTLMWNTDHSKYLMVLEQPNRAKQENLQRS
jgi:hypothetical protein